MQDNSNEITASAAENEAPGIVSVNSRGGDTSGNAFGKILFVLAVGIVLAVGSLVTFNQWRAHKRAQEAAAGQTEKDENKSAVVGQRRQFDTDPPPLPPGATGGQPGGNVGPNGVAGANDQACADGMPGTIMLSPDGKPMLSAAGLPMRVCKDGRVMVPAVQPQPGDANGAQPIGVTGGRPMQANGQPAVSRYAGPVMVPQQVSFGASSGATSQQAAAARQASTMQMVQDIMNLQKPQGGVGAGATGSFMGAGGAVGGTAGAPATNPPGSIGSMLTPSATPKVTASMIGDRSMILPKGRSIDCGMSMRLINEVAGMASCVLSSDVHSDDGRVVLLEKGSEATGEYVAAMAQGQRRLFVLWTRIKTTKGVVINLNSPAADSLGTSGMDGYIDNHWWERIGAAFMLSLVKDAIAFKTAEATGGSNGSQGVAVFQNSSQTGNNMAEKVLDSTINIKPTIYKNQGDRGTIYVARDLDFSTVYALQAR